MIGKAVLVLLALLLHAHSDSVGFGAFVWGAGKVVPSFVSPAFFCEAYMRPRSKRLQLFWLCLSVLVPIYTLAVVSLTGAVAR